MQPFADYLRAVRGNPTRTIDKKIKHLAAFDRFCRSRGRASSPIRLTEIDAYIVACARRLARRTISDICSTLRTYLRFLHITGAMDADLAASVMAPIARPAERPYRALPWSPGGHRNFPHPWPGQNPPPDGGGRVMITR